MYNPPHNAGMYSAFVLFPQLSRCGVGGVLCLYPKNGDDFDVRNSSHEFLLVSYFRPSVQERQWKCLKMKKTEDA